MDELMTQDTTGHVPLRADTLTQLPQAVDRPRYDRRAVSPGIVHIGLGNFHRAHQAWYVHRLMQQGLAMDWGIIGASVRHEDAGHRARLLAQDCLTTLIELDPSGVRAEVVGPMIDYLPIEPGHAALIRAMRDPAIRIVSLTVTEGGYFLDPATKTFDPTHPDIRHDAANLSTPRTAFGAIVAALAARRAQGQGPFTCQSCDNLPGNGAILRAVVVGLARLSDPALADWIDATVSFPNAMVDCIVPATGPKEIALARSLGVADDAPVTHENFRQWVMEDAFCAGRPDWDKVGATLSDRVHDFEAQKLRLLNGGHQIIATPGELLGLVSIADTMNNATIRSYFRKVATTEIIPHVTSVPGVTPAQYLDLIAGRFANPAIHDTVRRVAFDGASRQTGFLIPTIRDAMATGADHDGLALSQALWARMCLGIRDDGSRIAPNDPIWGDLNAVANVARTDPAAWLQQRQFYGAIADHAGFADAFCGWMRQLADSGVENTLSLYLSR